MSRDGRERADTDGQSEVVGVILLAAVVVLLMGVFGTFNLHVLVRVDGSRQRFPIDSANVSGDRDDEFAPTERFARDHTLGGGDMEALVIHTPSNTILQRENLAVRSG